MNIPIPLIVVTITIAFSIMTTLIGILLKVLANNTKAIEEMKIFIAKQETADGYEEKECNNRHTYITKKLSQHSDFIQNHEIRLSKLEK